MAQINLNLDGQRLFATQSVIASDTIDYITVQVKHTTDWDDCSIWAHFENGEEHYAVEVINQRIEADKHLNLFRGVWKVWCVGFAFNGEDIKCRITSTVETIHVQQTGGLDGDPLPEIPPSESEQILGIAISAKEAAQAAKDAADEIPDRINSSLAEAKASGEFDGAAGKDGEDGGYYTPEVTQPEANTLQFDFAPSKPDMPVVEPVQVNLPTPESGGNVDLEGYATEQYVREYAQPKGEYLTEVPDGYATEQFVLEYAQPVGDYALKSEIPAVPVKSVNGKTGAVSLTASDVGALPSTYTPPNQTAAQVGADPKGTAAAAVAQHNTAVDSHNDIRLELKAINDRLTAFFDSDDQTLDEMSEIVAYITSNKALIDSITTSKVSVVDIINNLTTNVTNKPLSAAQGVVLKSLIDGLDTALGGKLAKSELTNAINTALAQAKASGEFDGTDGSNGKDGASVTVKSVSESTADGGSNVVTFSDGKTLNVKNGSKGSKGADGKTPVKGTDYYTAADKAEIVSAVIAALPVYAGEVV